jgi:release factor glutamine methyltransferase
MEHSSNSKVLFRSLVKAVTLDETTEEIESIVFMLLRQRKGLTREQVLAGKEVDVVENDFASDLARINNHEPIQYILGKAEFYGREFRVDKSVLIPRPETEILLRSALTRIIQMASTASVLDIGTGSGCIAITLALESQSSKVTALDISEDALIVARHNAELLGAKVNFINHDILRKPAPGKWDILISNPPYVLEEEAGAMRKNVIEFEPHMALFVPDKNPLVFYEAIARQGLRILSETGVIMVEINERMGKEAADLFSSMGYNSSVLRDLDGKDRIVIADLIPHK